MLVSKVNRIKIKMEILQIPLASAGTITGLKRTEAKMATLTTQDLIYTQQYPLMPQTFHQWPVIQKFHIK